MLFNSFEFLFAFLPVTLAGFFLLARLSIRAAAAWLTAASLFFYAWWDARYLLLLLGSITFNFACGTVLARHAGRMRWLVVASVASNLALLGCFKYLDFAIASANAALGTSMPLAGIVLPLGISFYTFTQIAFLVDAHRGEAREYRFDHYVLFVTWFPHLIAGPILHHRQLMPQFADVRTYLAASRNLVWGLALFTLGLAKKVLIADELAPTASAGFDAAAAGNVIGATQAWMSTLAYTFQLYFDFSGYCDMAMGLSKLFGVDLPLNFNSPYQARSLIDFWRRWHMTLSRFLRDYLYFALGGSRRGQVKRYANLLATMVLGGLWHGANWTFVLWGVWHGLLLMANHAWRGLCARWKPISPRAVLPWRVIATGMTFATVTAGWVLFRAESVDAAARMYLALIGTNGVGAIPAITPTWLLLSSALIVFCLPNGPVLLDAALRSENAPGRRGRAAQAVLGPVGGVAAACLLLYCVTRLTLVSSEFLYFQF